MYLPYSIKNRQILKNKTFMTDNVTNLRQTITAMTKNTARKSQSRSNKRTKNQPKSLKTPKICLLVTDQKLAWSQPHKCFLPFGRQQCYTVNKSYIGHH